MTTKRWLFLFLIAALACAGVLLWQVHAGHGNVVHITQDGTLIHAIDLSQVEESYSLTIEYEDHYNIVQVTAETVWVSEADCGNQVCVEHGPLRDSGSPITCLPHRLVISWAESLVDA